MASTTLDSTYYVDMFSTDTMRSVFSDKRKIETWLETEVALAIAESRVGLVPQTAADNIAASGGS